MSMEIGREFLRGSLAWRFAASSRCSQCTRSNLRVFVCAFPCRFHLLPCFKIFRLCTFTSEFQRYGFYSLEIQGGGGDAELEGA
jgi:hypothetical protein